MKVRCLYKQWTNIILDSYFADSEVEIFWLNTPDPGNYGQYYCESWKVSCDRAQGSDLGSPGAW